MGRGKNISQDVGGWFDRHYTFFIRFGLGAGAIVLAGMALVIFLPQILGLFAPKLDLAQDLYSANRPVALTFVDAKGDVVGHRGAIVGERLALGQMPAYLPAAFITMEDRSFWSNSGIDMKGLLRAAYLNMRAHHVVAGGSTITQQVAKIVFLTPDRTFARKFQEVFDAAALNKSLSKQQILELYLNRIYLGSGAYGVDGAAHVYFSKSARNLTVAEAAMLATLTRAPSAFSPRRDLAAAQARASVVLRAMVQTGTITQAQADNARAHPAVVTDRSIQDARNYYFDTAADEVKGLIAGKQVTGDLLVHTVFEPRIEEAARKSVDHILSKYGRRRRAHQAAVVVMKPDGAVTAIIGGRDYDESTYNRATLAHRQTGSAFKAFVYLAALEDGISPWDTRTDQPISVNGWSPTNYGGENFGTITVADALAHSVNTISVELEQEVGVTAVIAAAERCGITSPLEPNASLALGTADVTPFEMTSAYATFANHGMKVTPYLTTEIDDSAGHVLYRRTPPRPVTVVAEHVNRDLTAMLYGVVMSGTGEHAYIPGHEVAGKTGTTQSYHDAWFVGFSADYVTGVWVGNDNALPMGAVVGGSLPADIWHDVMMAAEKGLPATPLDRSEPEAPIDQSGTIFTAGGPDGEYAGPPPPQQPQQPRQPQQRGGFWNWLFGGDNSSSGNAQGAPSRSSGDEPPVQDAPGTGQAPPRHWRSDPGAQQAPAVDPNAPRQFGTSPDRNGNPQQN